MAAMTRDTAVDSRQEILHTAGRLFQQQGYDATSMNDIAAALKLSKGGLYHHFQSKDEILFHTELYRRLEVSLRQSGGRPVVLFGLHAMPGLNPAAVS